MSLYSVLFDTPCFPRPTRHHGCGATRDLLLQVLSKLRLRLSFHLSSFFFALSSLTPLAFRNPRGTTVAVLRVTYCCKCCLNFAYGSSFIFALSSLLFHLCSFIFALCSLLFPYPIISTMNTPHSISSVFPTAYVTV